MAEPLPVWLGGDRVRVLGRVQSKRETWPRCGAYARSTGEPCRAPAHRDPATGKPRNGRCKLHGGKSTGPRTPEGRARALRNLRQWATH